MKKTLMLLTLLVVGFLTFSKKSSQQSNELTVETNSSKIEQSVSSTSSSFSKDEDDESSLSPQESKTEYYVEKHEGLTPRTIFSAIEDGNTETVLSLINEENIDTQNEFGITPLMAAINSENEELAFELIKRNANINLLDNENTHALSFAVLNGMEDTAKMLLDKDINPNDIFDNQGRSILSIAADTNQIELVKDLLKKEIDLDQRDHHGETALMKASRWDNDDIVKLLLENGAKRDTKNNNSKTAYDIATDYEAKNSLNLL